MDCRKKHSSLPHLLLYIPHSIFNQETRNSNAQSEDSNQSYPIALLSKTQRKKEHHAQAKVRTKKRRRSPIQKNEKKAITSLEALAHTKQFKSLASSESGAMHLDKRFQPTAPFGGVATHSDKQFETVAGVKMHTQAKAIFQS